MDYYKDGVLEGLVNIIQKFSNPKKQMTSSNEVYEITFVKSKRNNGYIEFSDGMIKAIDNKPDVISLEKATYKKDKWGNKLSEEEIKTKLANVNLQLSKSYQSAKTKKTTGQILLIAGIISTVASIPVISAGDEYPRSDNDFHYNTNWNLVYAGCAILGAGIVATIASFPVKHSGSKKSTGIINEYNHQITQQAKNKPVSELHFGVTPSGGFGLTFNF